jgi:transposase
MGKHSKSMSGVTVGVDLGDKFSWLCVLDESGEITEETRVATTPKALRRRMSEIARCRVVVEVGTHSPWVQRQLEGLGHEVIVANARQVRLIHKSPTKNDRLDAERLARLGRMDPKLLSPLRHRKTQTQVDRALLRSRGALVETRTKLINHVRGIVKSCGARLRSCSARSFHRQVAEELPEALKPSLLPMLTVIGTLNATIRDYERRIEHVAAERYPETELLRQVTGVGLLTALSYVVTIEDPHRFCRSRTLGAYLGLRPRESQSGQRAPELRITKAGDTELRRLLVGSAHYILGPFGVDSDLRQWGLSLAGRGRKNAKKRAVVAVARKLAVLLHRLWVTGEVYEPLRVHPAGSAA